MDQDLVQVFFVQDEEISKPVSDDICRAPVAPTHCQQTANNRHFVCEVDEIGFQRVEYITSKRESSERFSWVVSSPDLSKDRSCSESDEHRLSIGSSDHLHLPGFYDVHFPANFILRGKRGRCINREARPLPSVLGRRPRVPSCRRNPQAGTPQNANFSACQRSSASHNPFNKKRQ